MAVSGLRILIVNHCHPDTPHICATRLREFAGALSERGHRVALVTEPLRGQLAKGQKLLIGFKPTAQAATLTVPVSLNGFTDGLAALPAK